MMQESTDATTRTAVGVATSLKYSGDLDGETLISRFSCAWHTARRTHSRSAASPMLRSDAMRRDRAIPDLTEANCLCFELGQ